jgi:hypothetical protein
VHVPELASSSTLVSSRSLRARLSLAASLCLHAYTRARAARRRLSVAFIIDSRRPTPPTARGLAPSLGALSTTVDRCGRAATALAAAALDPRIRVSRTQRGERWQLGAFVPAPARIDRPAPEPGDLARARSPPDQPLSASKRLLGSRTRPFKSSFLDDSARAGLRRRVGACGTGFNNGFTPGSGQRIGPCLTRQGLQTTCT